MASTPVAPDRKISFAEFFRACVWRWKRAYVLPLVSAHSTQVYLLAPRAIWGEHRRHKHLRRALRIALKSLLSGESGHAFSESFAEHDDWKHCPLELLSADMVIQGDQN